MAILEQSTGSPAVPGTGRDPRESPAVPDGLAGVGEALALGTGSVEACREAGRGLASGGTPLEEALDRLRAAARRVRGRDPSYDEVHALASGWADSTLGYLHRLGCGDPATGLASQAHLRQRLSEVLAAPEASYALLLAELPPGQAAGPAEAWGRVARIARLGEAVRTVAGPSRTVAGVGGRRVAALVPCDRRLGRRVRLLRDLTEHARPAVRVWVEPLPADEAAAVAVLDALARG